MMTVQGSPDDFKSAALRVVISASLSLAVMIVDFGWLIRDEVKYIYPRLRSSWYARIYMLARYIGMVSQIFNVYFTVRMYLGIPVSKDGCLAWFSYQTLVVQFLLASVEGPLMHRIYALFLRNRYILWILIMFAAGQVASLGVSARLSLPSISHTDTCMVVRSYPGNAYFSATTMTTNIVIFMTFWKYLRLPETWTRGGIGRVVIRDSALALLAISALMLFFTLCSLEVIRPMISGNITYYWFVCVLWVSVGRVIVNYEKLPREAGDHGNDVKSNPQLTSQIQIVEVCSLSEVGSTEGSSSEVDSSMSTWSGGFEMTSSKASQLSLSECTSESVRHTLHSSSSGGSSHLSTPVSS